MDTDLLTADEVAEYLRISLHTTRKLLREKTIPALKAGREWRVRRAALDAYLKGEPLTGNESKPQGAQQ